MADIVLVPGFWLGGWAWDQVAQPLREAGHEVIAVTLPGLESAETDRQGISLENHIDYVVQMLEDRRLRDVLLVGHSGGGSVVYGTVDRAVDRVATTVYVDSGPLPDGASVSPHLPPDVLEVPLPTWDELRAQGSSLAGLDEAQLSEFRRRSVPEPAGPMRDPLRLTHPARTAVPATLINCSFPTEQVKELIEAGHPWFAELRTLRVVRHVDLPTGHWPMFSRPGALARILGAIAEEVDQAVAATEV